MMILIRILLVVAIAQVSAGSLWAQEKSDSTDGASYESKTLDQEIDDATSGIGKTDSLESITEGATENQIGGNDPFGTSGDGIGNPSPGDDIFD